MTLLVGIALLIGSIGLVWTNRPKDGVESALFSMPLIGPSIPLVLTIAIAFGLALTFKAIVG